MTVTAEDLRRVRQHECRLHGHSWTVISAVAVGPVRIVCGNCAQDGGLHRLEEVTALRHLVDEQQGEIRRLERLLEAR